MANVVKALRSLLPLLILLAAAPAKSALLLTQVPAGMRKQSSPITIAWTGGLDRVHLRASTSPGAGASIAHYDSLHLPSQLSEGALTFKINPDIPALYRNTDLRFGVNYCILTDGKQISPEFIIIVESSNAPTLLSPANAASITDLTPTFSWTGSAPYYTVLVSDEPFKISDSGTVTGVSAIWQIITPGTSARYGDPDPSGINGVPAPPLISGKTYNWLALNNYANNTGSTSQVAPVPASFTYAPAPPLPQAQLIEPKDIDTIHAADQIKFRWSLVDGAVSYKVELLEENLVSGSQADVAIWKASSTGGQIILDKASSLLRRYRYKWRVYAIGATGSASISAKRSFFYDIQVGTINVKTANSKGTLLAYVPVKVSRLGGASSGVFQSGSTDANGSLDLQNAPLGQYEISVTGADGYLPRTDTLNHNSVSGTSTAMILSPVLGKLLGKVTTAAGAGILNAKVLISGSDGSNWSAATNSQGEYSLGLPYGNWQVTAKADGYVQSAIAAASLGSSAPSRTLGFQLKANPFTLSGTVRNSFAQKGIFGATVFMTQGADTRTAITDGNGNFSFSVASGDAVLRASSPGFAAPEPQKVTLDGDKVAVISLDPNASILSGRTIDGAGTALPKASVTATPKAGATRGIVSDNQGFFELSLPAGDWTLTAAAAGYTARAGQKYLLDVSKTVQGVNFILDRNRSVITGRATENGGGLAGVTVTAASGATALSDNAGFYRLQVNGGNQVLSAAKEGYLIYKTYSLSVNPGDTVTNVNFAATANAGVARGKVLADGSGVIGADVSAANQATKEVFTQASGPDGSFVLSLPAGDYQITAAKEGFALLSAAAISLLPGAAASDLKVKLVGNQGFISGVVASGNLSLSGCEVAYRNSGDASLAGKTVTDPDGRYSLSLQAGAAYQVSAACAGYQTAAATSAVLARAAQLTLNFNPVKAGALYGGRIVDSRGTALAGVKVTAEKSGEAASLESDFSGKYQFSLASGLYTITMSKLGYRSLSRQVQLSLGSNANAAADTLASSAGRMAVRVSSEGTAVPGAFVGLSGLSGAGGASFVTDADGRFTAENLPAGNYLLTASAEGFGDGKIPSISVGENKLSSVDVTLVPNRGTLSGIARIGTAAAAGVKIAASGPGVSRGAVTQADGSYLIDRLPAGTYAVSAALPGYSSDKSYAGLSLASPGSLANLDFILTKNAGSLSGTLSGAAAPLGIQLSVTGRKGGRAEAACDAAGKFSIPSLPADVYALTVIAPGYKLTGATQNPDVTVSAPTVFNPVLTPAVFQLSGKVLNQSGLALAGLPVELRNSGQVFKTVSASDGGFSISGVPADDDYLLSVKPPTSENDGRDTAFSEPLDAPASVKADIHTLSRRTGVSGTVFLDGAPIEGALLRLTGANNDLTAISQPDGSFKMQRVAGSDSPLSLSVSKSGAGGLDTSIIISTVESKSGLALRLKTLKLTLSGLLRNSEGKAIAGGKVVLSSAHGLDTAKAGSDGRFAFTGLAANQSLTLATAVDRDKYDNIESSLTLKEKDDSAVITAPVHAASVAVEVKDQLGAKVDGAEVVLNGRSAGTANQGTLTIRNLARGDYLLLAGKPSYKSSAEARLSLSGDTSTSLTLTVTKLTGGVYGSLSDTGLAAPDGAASRKLAGAVVSLVSPFDTLRDTANALGQYSIDGMADGRKYGILASLPGYRSLDDSVTGSLQVQSRDIKVLPFPGSAVGQATAGARIRLFDLTGEHFLETRYAPGGYFAFGGLRNQGGYALQAVSGSAGSAWRPFTADAGLALRIDASADRQGGVQGKITAGSAVAVSGALVKARDEATGNEAWALSDGEGKYSLFGLTAGRYTLSVERLGYKPSAAKVVSVSASSFTSGADVVLEANQNGLGGTVMDASGLGVSALVTLARGSDTLKTQSAEGGQFLFTGLTKGSYNLAATRAGYASPSPSAVTYDGDGLAAKDVSLALKANRIIGTVRDAVTNLPLAGATVGASSGSSQVQTDSLGRFELIPGGASLGMVLVDAQKAGYLSRRQIPVQLDSSASAAQDMALAADYKFDGELDVAVKEGKDTLAGLIMALQPFHPDDAVLPGLTGKVPSAFKNLRRPAPYLVKVKRSGFKDLSRVVDLTGNTPVTVTLAYPTSQIRLLVTGNGAAGKGVDANLDGKSMAENPDTTGLYESSAKLPPGRYEASLKDLDPTVIPMASRFITLGEDSVRTDTLPLPFHIDAIEDSIIATAFQVRVLRVDSLRPAPAVVCSLYYRIQGDPVWSSLKLDSTAGAFAADLPAQERAGTYEYYFVLHSPRGVRTGVVMPAGTVLSTSEAVYTNAQTPGRFSLRDPFLLHSISLLPQRLETDTSLYSLSAKDIFQVRMRGENGRDLDKYFDVKASHADTAFTVSWSFADASAASQAGLSLTPDTATPRLVGFHGGTAASDSVFAAVCAVRMGAVRLSKSFLVKIQDLAPVSIGIKYVKENRNLEAAGAALPLANNNPSGYQFSAFAVTKEGRLFNISPRWSFGADSSAGSLTQQGTFVPDSTVARGAALRISDTLADGDGLRKAFAFAANVTTFAQVTPAPKGNAVVANGDGVVLNFPLAGLTKGFTISMRKPSVSGLQRSSPLEEVVGDIIDVDLSESQPFKADSGAIMSMPVTSNIARQRKVYLGHWNSAALAWDRVDSVSAQELVSGKVKSFSKYAVIMGSLPLGAYDFVAVPNPFSALDPYGLQFGYKVSSDVSSQVAVKIEVYNMLGDKVYESVETQIGKGDAVVPGAHKADPAGSGRRIALGPYVWDGRDTKGVPCRNGRYLLKLTVKDGRGSKEYLKKVVMLK